MNIEFFRSRASTTITDQAIVSGGNFLTVVVATRFLGLEAFGVLALCLLIVALAQALQASLFLTPMLSVAPKHVDSFPYFAPLFVAQLLCTSISALFVAVIIFYSGPTIGIAPATSDLAGSAAFAVFSMQLHEFVRRKAFAQHRPATALKIDLLRYSSQSMALPAFYLIGYTSVPATLFILGTCALGASFLHFPKFIPPPFTRHDFGMTAQKHWQMAKWLLPSVLAQWTGINMFTIVVGATLGATAAGALRAAQTLLGIVAAFFQAMDNLQLPKAAHIFSHGGKVMLRSHVPRMLRFYIGISAPILISLAVPSKYWMSFLYGAEYSEYSGLVMGLAANQFLIACALPFSVALRAMEQTLPILLSHTAISVFALSASWPLATHFGLAGVVLGLIISQGSTLIILATSYRKLIS